MSECLDRAPTEATLGKDDSFVPVGGVEEVKCKKLKDDKKCPEGDNHVVSIGAIYNDLGRRVGGYKICAKCNRYCLTK